MAVVAARATRLPIYSSFAKEGNLSDLFAKGEAISTVFNVLGIGLGIQLASTICSSIQGKVYDIILQLNFFCNLIYNLNASRSVEKKIEFISLGTHEFLL